MFRETLRQSIVRTIIRSWPFPFAHSRLMRFLNASAPNVDILTCKLRGYPLKIRYEPQSYIGRSLYFRGMYEEQIIGKLASLLESGMTFLDVGANIGLHTIVAAHCVGPTGRVLAVEPQERPWLHLQENIALNRLGNVTVLRCALGAREGAMPLFRLSKRNSGMATLAITAEEEPLGSETVDVKRLGSIAAAASVPRIDAVKIDVEGAELDVLSGSADFLSRRWPKFMLIECVDAHLRRFHASSADLIEFLWRSGYSVRALHRGRWETVNRAEELSADLLALRRD